MRINNHGLVIMMLMDWDKKHLVVSYSSLVVSSSTKTRHSYKRPSNVGQIVLTIKSERLSSEKKGYRQKCASKTVVSLRKHALESCACQAHKQTEKGHADAADNNDFVNDEINGFWKGFLSHLECNVYYSGSKDDANSPFHRL